MAEEEVGLRLTLKDRKVTSQGLQETKGDLTGVGDAAETAGKKAEESGRRFDKMRSFLGTVGKGVLYAATSIGALTAAVGGVALKKGFDRLNSIDQATAKLTGLGHSAGQVSKIMNSALAAVRGTAFGLDEAATVSASSVAAGIKPGKELEKTLRLVADAATIGGTSMADMGAIFNKVATSNKVQGDVINQLNDKGIPIVQLLGKSMHKTAAQVMEMSQKGQIGFAQFSKAMQAGVGGAALKSGNTFTGAWKNLMASLGRIGAGLLSGIFPHLAPGVQGITAALAPLEKKANSIGQSIGKVLGPAFEKLGPVISRVAAAITGFDWSQLNILAKLKLGTAAAGGSKLGDAFGKLKAALAGIDWSKVGAMFSSTLADGISVTAVVVKVLADHLGLLAKIMPVLLVAYGAMKVAQAAENVLTAASIPLKITQAIVNQRMTSAMRALTAQMVIANGAQVENTVAIEAGTAAESGGILTRIRAGAVTAATTAKTVAMNVATKAAAAGQWLLNAAMDANPLGLIVIAIAAVVAGLVIFFTKTKTGRRIVESAFAAMGDAGTALWDHALRPAFKWIVDGFLGVASAIVHGAASAFGWIKGIGGKLKDAAATFDRFRDSVNRSLDGVHDKTATLTIRTRTTGPGAGSAPANKMATSVQMAHGGIIRHRPGGVPVTAAEAGVDEAYVPLNGRRYLIDGSGVTSLPPISTPTLSDLPQPDYSKVGPTGPRQPIHVHVDVDRKTIATAVLDGFDDKGARL